ncbi:MAG: hypothetical protein Q4D71_06010, partial [Oscillospiraceae bacterium]|nr:hypothetical protein [Oscillospiraceae bacterium]
MDDSKQIYEFACKWLNKLSDPRVDDLVLESHQMAEECFALGFELDCGHAFEEKYKEAFWDYDALDSIIDKESDVMLLGSALFSKWRYYTHWAEGGSMTYPSNREWFIRVLERI